MNLDTATLDVLADAIADRLLERLDERLDGGRLLDVDAVARYLNVTPDWVYAHQTKLGVIRLGTGPKARLRFRREDIEQATPGLRRGGSDGTGTRTEARSKPSKRRRIGASPGSSPLLPIRGRSERVA